MHNCFFNFDEIDSIQSKENGRLTGLIESPCEPSHLLGWLSGLLHVEVQRLQFRILAKAVMAFADFPVLILSGITVGGFALTTW